MPDNNERPLTKTPRVSKTVATSEKNKNKGNEKELTKQEEIDTQTKLIENLVNEHVLKRGATKEAEEEQKDKIYDAVLELSDLTEEFPYMIARKFTERGYPITFITYEGLI